MFVGRRPELGVFFGVPGYLHVIACHMKCIAVAALSVSSSGDALRDFHPIRTVRFDSFDEKFVFLRRKLASFDLRIDAASITQLALVGRNLGRNF